VRVLELHVQAQQPLIDWRLPTLAKEFAAIAVGLSPCLALHLDPACGPAGAIDTRAVLGNDPFQTALVALRQQALPALCTWMR
jgi:hypothetical protein